MRLLCCTAVLVLPRLAAAAADGQTPTITWFGWTAREGGNQPFIWMLLNFALLLVLLVVFVRKPLRNYLSARRETVTRTLADVAALRDAEAARLAEIEAKVARLDHEIAQIHAETLAAAEAEKTRIISAAVAEAERLLAVADQALARDVVRLRRLLAHEAIDAAISEAKGRLGHQLGPAEHARLAQNFLTQVDAMGANR